jgi:hypothetical protein
MNVATFVLVLAVFLTCLYTLRKVRNIHLLVYSSRDQLQTEIEAAYHQAECLRGLYIDLGITKSLPGTRGWAASPDFLMELSRYALRAKPAIVVECSSGTSTIVLARCMQMNGVGKVYSLEHDAVYAAKTTEQLMLHGLSEYAEVIHAPLRAIDLNGKPWRWYAVESLPEQLSIDMLVVDGPPETTGPLARYPAGPALFPQLACGARVYLDDANRATEKETLQRWASEFPGYAHQMAYCEKGCAVINKPANA